MAAAKPSTESPSPPPRASRDPTDEPVEPGHLPGPTELPPSGLGAAVAAVLLCIVVILVVLMVTGINQQIPYLHPTSGDAVTVYGDRVTYDYEFVANGSLQNVTTGYLCAQCPMHLTTSAAFTLDLNITNPNYASEDVGRLVVPPPFVLEAVTPSASTVIAAGLSEAYTLTVQTPAEPGTYVVSIVASINVS